jgi:hypothetical protein
MSSDQFRSWLIQAMAKRERRAIAACHRFAERHPLCGTCDDRCTKQWLEMLRLNSGVWGRVLFGANKQLDRVLLPDDERQVIWKLLNRTRGDDETCSPLAGLEAAHDYLTGLPQVHVLSVDLNRLTITLDGKTYDVRSEAALRWMKVLAEHPGEWISGPDLRKYDQELDSCRTDRLKPKLPDPISDLIDSDPGKGSRIRLDLGTA